jgi:carbamoyl-phosphate synthase large subunit
MSKRQDINKILVLGAGPIVIGQACEFDYSGVQACKALREEGYKVVLVNSNPATIMTDPDTADVIYIEPITWEVLAKIIAKEEPDALLPTMGGQTALNCALDLSSRGILDQHSVEMIGATKEAIDMAEDRELFRDAMREIHLDVPRSDIAKTLPEALEKQKSYGFPVIIRPSFTLGGTGSGIAYNHDEFETIVKRGLYESPTNEVLIEESIIGWKEFEMEVVRDKADNCIIICSIENIDPMGVHTGDSITVAPAQTLTDKEYQRMRNASIAVLRKIGVETGGSNVQFAVNPVDGRLIVIEMNPRVSRSSALASKATGFPIAKVAAKLAVGYTLDELKNEITNGQTPSSFEPTIDYVVTKIPRFAFEKFKGSQRHLTTQMKSVGEVMAIGRTFQESLQKALRGLEIDIHGFDPILDLNGKDAPQKIEEELSHPTASRILYVGDAFRANYNIDDVYRLTRIDPWFLIYIKDIIDTETKISGLTLDTLDKDTLFGFKAKGFSDQRIANLIGVSQEQLRATRLAFGIRPVYKRIDTCSAEFETKTAYMYSTYEAFCESDPTDRPKVIILGGGPNRIGQGIEFDYCCVHAAYALKESGYESIMINCNPETVSTDFDTSDRLYFEPLTVEDVMEIIDIEKPTGVIVQYGGQTPLKLAKTLEQYGVNIIGTSPDSIDLAEDRERFQKLVNDIGLLQPPNGTASTVDKALQVSREIGFPLVVRPSYVLGGRAMEVVFEEDELEAYMDNAISESNTAPILLDRFLDDAIEVDVDALSDGENVIVCGIMEHIEQAGVHSGDSTCSLPTISLSSQDIITLKEQVKSLGIALKVKGLMNVQFAIQNGKIYLLEVNPRASRTIPFVSKTIGIPLAKLGTRLMTGSTLAELNISIPNKLKHIAVKESVFPFSKFPESDPILGPEMKSTGEVMGVAYTFGEAYAKAQLASGVILPRSGNAFISVKDSDKPKSIKLAQELKDKGFNIFATRGTAEFLNEHDVSCEAVNKVREGRPHIVDLIINNDIQLIVNTTEGKRAVGESESIRREAVIRKVTYYTTIAAALATCEAMYYIDNLTINRLSTLHDEITYE